MRRMTRTLGLSIVGFFACAALFAQQGDPEAVELFKKATAAGKTVQAYEEKSTIVTHVKSETMDQRTEISYTISLERPKKIHMEIDTPFMDFTVVSDGDSIYTYLPSVNKYTAQTVGDDLEGALQRSVLGQFGMGEAFQGMFGEEGQEKLLQDVADLRLDGEEELDGFGCRKLRYKMKAAGQDMAVEAWVDSKNHFIRKTRTVLIASEGEGQQGGMFPVSMDVEMVLKRESLDLAPEFPADRFSFSPPEGAQQVEDLLAAMAEGVPAATTAEGVPAPVETTAEAYRGTEGWHKTIWGMNPAEISELYPKGMPTEFGYFVNGKMADRPVGVGLHFVRNQLYRVEVAFTAKHVNPKDYLADLNEVKKTLDKKYGESPEVELVWHDDVMKNNPDQWGAAVAYGDLEIHTRWETEESQVTLSCQGEDFEVEMNVVYESKELAPLAADQEEYLEGRARSWAKAAKAASKRPSQPSATEMTAQVEAALARMDLKVTPPAGEEELRKRYETVKSGEHRRGEKVDAEAILAAGAERWPQEYTANPPGPKGMIVATDLMKLGTAVNMGSASPNALSTELPQEGVEESTFYVANLTLAKVKDTMKILQASGTQVEILEGPHKGELGWVLTDWVY